METNTIILQRLDALSAQVAQLAEQSRARAELVEEMTPIAREALATAVARLDALDQQGYFAFARELAGVGKRVVEGFTPEDVHQLGDAVVAILDVVRALTRPEVLQIASDAADSIQHAERAKPVGAFGALRAMRDDDVQKGLGLFVDVLRQIGRGINATAKAHGALAGDRHAKLAELLGPRKSRKLARPERKLLPAPERAAVPAPPPVRPHPRPSGGDGEGEAATWTPQLGETIAAEHGITLGAQHWAVVDAARRDFVETHASPNIQRLTQVAGVTTRDLYQLFPKAPARTIARIAGLPKPAGCL